MLWYIYTLYSVTESSPVMISRVASYRPAFWKWRNIVQAIKCGPHLFHRTHSSHFQLRIHWHLNGLPIAGERWPALAPTLNPFKALLTRQKRKVSRIVRDKIYISQLIIVTLCWSYAFIFFKKFDKKVQQSWSSNSFLSILGDVLFLPIIKDWVQNFRVSSN